MRTYKVKIIIRSIIDFLLSFTSYSLIKDFYYNARANDSIVLGNKKDYVDDAIIEEIFTFFAETGPLYENLNLAPELEIGGAWAGNIVLRRKIQLACIESNDFKGYANLVNNMFRNELVDSMWDVLYFSKIDKTLPKLPKKFVQLADGFQYLTNKSLQDLAYCSGGGEWGMLSDGGIIKPTDPGDGIKAYNLLLAAESYGNQSKLTICDLGSGFGGMIEKLARWHDGIARYILVDIPLNLTTAYAYFSFGFENESLHLIKTPEQFNKLLETEFSSNQFIFLPSAYLG